MAGQSRITTASHDDQHTTGRLGGHRRRRPGLVPTESEADLSYAPSIAGRVQAIQRRNEKFAGHTARRGLLHASTTWVVADRLPPEQETNLRRSWSTASRQNGGRTTTTVWWRKRDSPRDASALGPHLPVAAQATGGELRRRQSQSISPSTNLCAPGWGCVLTNPHPNHTQFSDG